MERISPNLWTVVRTQTVLTPGQATYSLTPQTITVLDASIVLNFGSSNESRRFITPISRTEYLSYANQQTPGQPTVWWQDRLISPTITFYPIPDGNGPYTFDYYSCTQLEESLPGGEIPNIPYRWIDAVVRVFDLSPSLASIRLPVLTRLHSDKSARRKAEQAWKRWNGTRDVENTPIVFAPGLSSYYSR